MTENAEYSTKGAFFYVQKYAFQLIWEIRTFLILPLDATPTHISFSLTFHSYLLYVIKSYPNFCIYFHSCVCKNGARIYTS